MFYNDFPATPRARPPAQARRSVSLQAPPPYAAASALQRRSAPLETLVASPIGTPAQEGSLNFGQKSFKIEELSWMKERSREELTDLLTKAENIIRERENQLTVTSAFCRSLYENSVTLKSKHKALLAGLPGPSTTSTEDFPSVSPTPPTHPLQHNDSFVDTPSASPRPLLAARRLRKISVSPADIALLSDQNAELLQKLEKLESESRQADQAGRRALRRLEKEIEALRDELEVTQARSEELEEKTRHEFGKGVEIAVEEVLKRKHDKVAKIKALRGKGGEAGGGEEGECEIRDFAPPPFGGVLWSPTKPTRSAKVANTENAALSICNISRPPSRNAGDMPSPSVGPSQDLEENIQTHPLQESALILQLLSKIQELEETNTQIKQQQVETATKLRFVQRDAESIGRLYECLGDPASVEWEVVVDDDHDKDKKARNLMADDTIRFRSLRRTLESDSLKPAVNTNDGRDGFHSGLAADNCSTAYGNFALNIGTYKQRKSVVGLFDSGPEPGTCSKPSVPGKQRTSPAEYVDEDKNRRPWPADVDSPALSSVGLSLMPLHTLGSELGSEFGDDWGAKAGNHHLRATSLGDLTDIDMGRRSPSLKLTAASSHTKDHSDSSTVMQLILEAPTPERPKANHNSEEDQFTSRYRRMSQTVRSRTSQWVDGRFKETLLGSSNLSSVSENKRVFASLPTVDTIVETSTGLAQHSMSEGSRGEDAAQRREKVGDVARKGEKGVVTLVLEVWLWLQFAVIILVFLWTMAKRGPKTVLENTERKRHGRLS